MKARLCPWCREAGRTVAVDDGGPDQVRSILTWGLTRGYVELWVRDGHWWCRVCGRLGDAPEIELIDARNKQLDGQLRHLVAGKHCGAQGQRALRLMADRLLRQWKRDKAPTLALELLHPWAVAHINPAPSREQLEALLDQLAGAHLESA